MGGTRSRIRDGIARVIFTVQGDTMVLLSGFIKKSQHISYEELDKAQKRKALVMKGNN